MKLNLLEMNTRNMSSFVLLIVSFILLYLGVTEPMLTMKAEIAGRELFNYKRSILQAVKDLYESDNYLVSFLILFFSIMIPVLKGIVILWAFTFGNFNQKFKAHKFIFRITTHSKNAHSNKIHILEKYRLRYKHTLRKNTLHINTNFKILK